MKEVGTTILVALHEAGIATDDDLNCGAFEVRSGIDGRKSVVLTGTSRSAERQFMQGLAEILGPVQNPRYLLVRYSWFGLR